MLSPERIAYDPARYLDVESVDAAVELILCPNEGMTAHQRWDQETPALMQIIERHVQPMTRVLDYGCGIGRLAKPLIEQLNCSVVGVDISPNMRALATSIVGSPKFFALDPVMFDALIDTETFDAAISVWTLQHCIDLATAIARIRNTLKLGSKLVILNNTTRCVPVENGDWADDGQDVDEMIIGDGFERIDDGVLDESIAPGWMQDETFWAVYRRI